ncbi:hypothetical protein MMC19_003903 [Ptychographa xylographoides]|nr:hypothetical protein [Ptychographa xylographoides]
MTRTLDTDSSLGEAHWWLTVSETRNPPRPPGDVLDSVLLNFYDMFDSLDVNSQSTTFDQQMTDLLDDGDSGVDI